MIHVEVIQPTRILLQKDYEHAIIPGIDGDFGVYEGHTPFLTKIRPGVLTLYRPGKDAKPENYTLHDGFVMVEQNSVKIICELSEKANEIDKERALSAKERAEKRLSGKSKEENIDFRRAELALKKAIARIEAKS